MKRLLLLAFSIIITFGHSQPGDTGLIFDIKSKPIDDNLLRIEQEIETIDLIKDLIHVTLADSIKNSLFTELNNATSDLYFLPSLFEQDGNPQAWVSNGQVVKITHNGFIYHFKNNELIRSMFKCFAHAGWSRCNGYAFGEFYFYWKNGFVYKTIESQKYDPPCNCVVRNFDRYHSIMELKKLFDNIIAIQE